jgi:serine/threonine-protein kinase HipA
LGLEISPFKLKLNKEINQSNEYPFDGLFGVFSDSLPDGWGRILFDRYLATKQVDLGLINQLHRLAYVGDSGAGALIYKPQLDAGIGVEQEIFLDEIATESSRILEGFSSKDIDNLFMLGGSSGGARPKINVAYHAGNDHFKNANSPLLEGYEHWLIKFPSSTDRPDIANIEFAYHKMAIVAGIEMSECKLFYGKTGRAYFGTKRFDRIGNNRLHLHSAAGLMHDNFRLSTLDYGNLMDCAFRLENSVEAYEKVLRIAAFNVFAHNRDDHSKNFSFLMDATGNWKMAPAYDLTFSNSSHGYHSTTVAGEGAKPNEEHLLKLANYFKVKQVKNIIESVREGIYLWEEHAKLAEVSKESSKLIGKAITPHKN